MMRLEVLGVANLEAEVWEFHWRLEAEWRRTRASTKRVDGKFVEKAENEEGECDDEGTYVRLHTTEWKHFLVEHVVKVVEKEIGAFCNNQGQETCHSISKIQSRISISEKNERLYYAAGAVL